MCMSCNNTGKPLKKTILFLAIVIGIGAITYIIFSSTNNPTIAATIPMILSFAFCPLMCVVMGVVMWIVNKTKNNVKKVKADPNTNNIEQQELTKHSEPVSKLPCCSVLDKDPIGKNLYSNHKKIIKK